MDLCRWWEPLKLMQCHLSTSSFSKEPFNSEYMYIRQSFKWFETFILLEEKIFLDISILIWEVLDDISRRKKIFHGGKIWQLFLLNIYFLHILCFSDNLIRENVSKHKENTGTRAYYSKSSIFSDNISSPPSFSWHPN